MVGFLVAGHNVRRKKVSVLEAVVEIILFIVACLIGVFGLGVMATFAALVYELWGRYQARQTERATQLTREALGKSQLIPPPRYIPPKADEARVFQRPRLPTPPPPRPRLYTPEPAAITPDLDDDREAKPTEVMSREVYGALTLPECITPPMATPRTPPIRPSPVNADDDSEEAATIQNDPEVFDKTKGSFDEVTSNPSTPATLANARQHAVHGWRSLIGRQKPSKPPRG